jgi:hypothetical protein
VARRAFRADVPAGCIGQALADISTEVASLRARAAAQVEADQRLLRERVLAMTPACAAAAPRLEHDYPCAP